MLLRLLDPELYSGDIAEGEPSKLMLGGRYSGDAGLDLRSAENARVHAGETKKLRLGVAVEIPEGCVGWLTGRSTTHLNMGLFVHEGKIDAGYRGEVHCFCTAQGSPVDIERGDRLCQLVVLKIERPVWVAVDELAESDRGVRGLGSTGKD